MEDQYCYLILDKSSELRELPTICSKGTIGELMLIPPQEEMPARLLCSFTDKHGNWQFDELWTCDLRGGDWRLISNGHLPKFSADGSQAIFWRSDDFAFHCLYVWQVKTGAIRPIVSVREGDPGSGPWWKTRWSRDSRAISIRGRCSGFQEVAGEYQEFDFIYLVSSEKIVTCK